MLRDPSDIISLLRADHTALRSLMAKMKSAGSTIEKKSLFNEFLPLLECHTYAEEETLIARALCEERLRPFAMEGLEEHDVTEFEADKMKKAATDDQWEARLKVLCEYLDHHLEEEEKDFFPAAEEVLEEDERVELGERYADAREKLKLAPIFQLPIRSSGIQSQTG